MNRVRLLALATSIASLSLTLAQAGHETAESKEYKSPVELREWFPDDPKSFVTVGGLFSEHLSGVYVDSMTGLWSPQTRDAFLFMDSRFHYEDNGQTINSTGLGFRKLLPDREVIIGANAYYDSIHSIRGNDFDQLGVGLEVLTHWVDARFNYYLPDNDQVLVDRRTARDNAGTKTYERREAALEGFNAEVGFLVPGICKYTEVRVYGGYFHYENPFGKDFEGFKARLEARLLPGVVANVEYWDDTKLNGGHWTAGVSASVPFSIYNLVTGRNPFEGIGECFTPREREFKERMSDMVDRSHRIQTVTSGDRLIDRERFEAAPTQVRGDSGIFFPVE